VTPPAAVAPDPVPTPIAPPSPSSPEPTKTPSPPQVAPSPPAYETLALHQRYEHEAANGTVDFTVTLVRVEADIACTTAGHGAAQNGHLIGLHVEIVDPTPPGKGEPPSISAADFRFVGAGHVVTADVDTDSSASCLENGWPNGQAAAGAPVAGTLVLDVPAGPGSLLYRPKSWTSGLRWHV
jgi:hypothetical protein